MIGFYVLLWVWAGVTIKINEVLEYVAKGSINEIGGCYEKH